MNNRISITSEFPGLSTLPMKQHIKKCIAAALKAEGVGVPCEINVLITNDQGIRAINSAYRNIDSATDVLSFPMFELEPGKLPERWDEYRDPDTRLVPLGDMAISLERAKAQAQEFGHSTNREVGYLTVHSVLHLLGYDHVDEGPMKKQMRAREEAILAEIELPREEQ
jgi:probable rRNA maturation factor